MSNNKSYNNFTNHLLNNNHSCSLGQSPIGSIGNVSTNDGGN